MKILLSGYNGHMGREVRQLIENGAGNMVIAAGVDGVNQEGDVCVKSFAEVNAPLDCVIDFSHHSVTKALTEFCVSRRLPLVLATTGQTDEEKQLINECATQIPVFFAANYSLGVALLIELAKKTAAVFPDAEIEIVEAHHDRKLDAPSGTALALAEAIKSVRPEAQTLCGRSGNKKREKNEIGISSVRLGNIVGIHEVIVGTQNQTITLKHEAHSRALFAEGALAAAEFIVNKPAGLYTMEHMVKA